MDKYKEYSSVDGKWIEDGFVSINADKIESEKNMSINIDGEPKIVKAIRLVSGTLHYIDKEDKETFNHSENKIQRRWGIIKKNNKIESSSWFECKELYPYDNWEDLESVIELYIGDRRYSGDFIGTVKIWFTEDFRYVTISGNNKHRWEGDVTSITLKCEECRIKK